MKEIPLRKSSAVALVDDEDYEFLSRFKWKERKHKRCNTTYATARIKGKDVRMHRLLLCPPDGMVVDHINHNGLDNRRANLRVCTQQQNSVNQRRRRKALSPYRGVSIVALFTHKGRTIRLGNFASVEEAAIAHDIANVHNNGEFALGSLNLPHALANFTAALAELRAAGFVIEESEPEPLTGVRTYRLVSGPPPDSYEIVED